VPHSLVIGGGLLGGTTAKELAAQGHDVTVFSRSFAAILQAGADLPGVRLVSGSIGPRVELAELIDSSDAVFYFAGGSTPTSAEADAGGSVELSVVPATTVLELMRETSTRRIVISSSGGTVYGEPHEHPTPEEHPRDPIGIHGQNALTIEHYAEFFARRHGLEPVILRIATAYGPGHRTRRGQGVIAAWIEAALDSRPLDVYGSLETRRDFIFASDVARAAVGAVFDAAPAVYNVGSGASHTLAEVVQLIGTLAGRELEIVRREARGVDVLHTRLDYSRISKETGWAPRTELAQGLQATWRWSLETRQAQELVRTTASG
jgi:UDP-glucose 4-epimerase